MTPTNPNDLARRFEAALEGLGVVRERLVVAVSGGLDSMVLLDLLSQAARRRELDLVVAHVDHGLRGAESEADRKFVEAAAAARGWRCRVEAVDVESLRRNRRNRARPSLEEAARSLRYQALRAITEELDAVRVATAHHLDDQAETVLLRILRGTSPEGLAGIAPVSRDGRVIRPLLGLRREALREHAEARGLRWREDASNQDTRFARNRLRQDWLEPLAEAFNPRLAEALARVADAARQDRAWLEPQVSAAFEQLFERRSAEQYLTSADAWGDLPDALARRLLERVIGELGGARELDRRGLDRALAFVCEGPGAPGGKSLQLVSPLQIRRASGQLLFERVQDEG